MLADWSERAISCNIRSGLHGFESCEAEIRIPFYEAFQYYQQLGPLKLRVNWGSNRIWEGRLEDPTQFTGIVSGLRVVALGYWVAYDDARYVAAWSAVGTDRWRVVNETDLAAYVPARYQIDTNQRLSMAPQKNATYANAGVNLVIAGLLHQIPDGSSKQYVGVSFDYEFICPAGWEFGWGTRPTPGGAFTSVGTIAATGALLTGCINTTFAAANLFQFYLYYNAASAAYAGETGANYVRITNVRLVASSANRINTTFTANRNAGTNVTATVGSTARMFVGQRLQIDNGSGVGESVIVLSIGSATQFNATFAKNHVIGGTVTAHLVYPDEIIEHCTSVMNAINPSQVNADLTLIQSQAVDIDDAYYDDDTTPMQVISDLIARGDDQTTPRQWVAMVYDDQKLIVRPRGSGAAWFTDVTDLEVVRTLTNLYNSVYGVYADANGRKLRTAASTDAASVAKFGITRRTMIEVDTNDSVQATRIRDKVLGLQQDPIPRATIQLDRIFDQYGNPYPLDSVRADDMLTIRNLPPILAGSGYDKIRKLVIHHTDYDVINNELTLELELPMPNTNVQLARALQIIAS